MTEEVKRGRGRPSKWGKGNSDKAAIANSLKKINGETAYYQQKLIEMGLAEIVLTPKGQQFVSDNG